MAKYFATVGIEFAPRTPRSIVPIEDYLTRISRTKDSIYFNPVTGTEIMRLITKLEPIRSSRHDDLNNYFIKELKDVISTPLSIIFNRSLQEGVFPKLMKLADVTPLHKAKARDESTNYRSISLLITLVIGN